MANPAESHIGIRGAGVHKHTRLTTVRLEQVWQPGADAVNEGETLQYDPTAYDCLHQLTFEWPSLR